MDSREELIALFGDRNSNGGFIRDLCFTVFRNAGRPNLEDGGKRDWANDTLPAVNAGIEKIRAIVAALAPPSPEAAGSAEAPVAAGEVNRELEKIADWWEPHWRGAGITPTADWLIKEIKAHAEASFEAVTAAQAKGDARAQDFRAGIEAAAKVIREDCIYLVGRIQAEVIAKKIEALAPPAGAGEKQ